jgi:hypothetical protein
MTEQENREARHRTRARAQGLSLRSRHYVVHHAARAGRSKGHSG